MCQVPTCAKCIFMFICTLVCDLYRKQAYETIKHNIWYKHESSEDLLIGRCRWAVRIYERHIC